MTISTELFVTVALALGSAGGSVIYTSFTVGRWAERIELLEKNSDEHKFVSSEVCLIQRSAIVEKVTHMETILDDIRRTVNQILILTGKGDAV